MIDPPYNFSDRLTMSTVKRGASANYNGTLKMKDLKDLPIKDLADPDGAILALWCPSTLIPQGLELLRAYGFTYKTNFIWVKNKKEPLQDIVKKFKKLKENFNIFNAINYISKFSLNDTLSFGMGRLFRASHEICLIGINNTKIYKHLSNKSQRSVSFAPNLKHSAKPENLQDSLELMFPNLGEENKIEIFARRQRPGWTCVGNQAPATMGEDIRISLNNLINDDPVLSQVNAYPIPVILK